MGGRSPTSPAWPRSGAPSSVQPGAQPSAQEGGAVAGPGGANQCLGRRMAGEADDDLGRKHVGRRNRLSGQTVRWCVAGSPLHRNTHTGQGDLVCSSVEKGTFQPRNLFDLLGTLACLPALCQTQGLIPFWLKNLCLLLPAG